MAAQWCQRYVARYLEVMTRLLVALALGLAAGCAGTSGRALDTAPLLVHDEPAVLVAALVVDLDTGETLLARDAERLLRPASTMKLLTTAAVCRRAPEAELETRLSASATDGGTATLMGGGDPFLSTMELHSLALALRQSGVTSCSAVEVIDPLAGAPRFGEGWMWDDEPSSFMPPLSAAPIDGGCVTVEVTGNEGGLDTRLVPVAGGLEFVVEPDPGRLRVSRGRYTDAGVVTITGAVPTGETVSRRITVPDPAAYTAWVLADALQRHRLLPDVDTVAVRSSAASHSSAQHTVVFSRALAEVVERTNKQSDNLGAELLLRLLPTCDGAALGAGSVEVGLETLREDVRRLGLDPDAYRLADGSGVSHYTLVSAELLVATLVDMHRRGGAGLELFERSLPVAGVDGTLASRMRGTPAEGRVRAKTGTISGVSGLAGYVTTVSGRPLAFAILVQNFVGPAAPWRDLQDSFCARLAAL